MSDDLLERAAKALREQGAAEPPSDRAAFMRARVLSQAKRSSRLRPQGMWQWAAVVCLGFFVSTAMAQVIRVQLPRVIEALRRELPAQEHKPKQTKPWRPKAAAPAAPSGAEEQAPAAVSGDGTQPEQPAAAEQDAVAPGVVTEPARYAAPAPGGSRPVKHALAKRSLAANIPAKSAATQPMAAEPELENAVLPQAPASPERAAPSQPKTPTPEPAELALFRRAQSLHLAHDPRAIEAWDAFLRAAPSSALAPEARYNRALGLVRARKFADARGALQPFADGAYGSYRKQEAQQLLARLPK